MRKEEYFASMDPCRGLYCGRTELGNGSLSDCSACPAGFRTNNLTMCEECLASPTLYQWLYLGLMALLPLCFNWIFIFYYNQAWKFSVFIQLMSAVIESGLSVVITLLVSEPRGEFTLKSCEVVQLSDWYTIFYNPKIKYTKTLYCAQEAVYPLYSIVFVYCLFALFLMLVVRPLLSYKFVFKTFDKKPGMKSLYAALYFYPIFVLIHAMTAGLIYYSYAYLLIVATLLGLVTYCVHWDAMTFLKIFGPRRSQHLFIIVCHFAMLSYSVIVIWSQHADPLNLAVLGTVPVPLLFFVLTERFSDPHNIARETLRQ